MIHFDSLSPDAWAALCMPMHEVIPATSHPRRGALYIGSWVASVDTELLEAHSVRRLVSVNDAQWSVDAWGDHSDGNAGDDRTGGEARPGVYAVVISDSTAADLRPHLDRVCAHIEKQLSEGENVLVHCQQGISRSSAVVIAFLMHKEDMSYDDALALLKEKRQCAKPNVGFERTLRKWDDELRDRREAGLRRKQSSGP